MKRRLPFPVMAAALVALCAAAIAQADSPRAEPIVLDIGTQATLYDPDIDRFDVEPTGVVELEQRDARHLRLRAQGAGRVLISIWGKHDSAPRRYRVVVSSPVAGRPRARAVTPPAPETPPTPTAGRQPLSLYVGAVETRTLTAVERLVVGNDKIAQASVLDNGDLLLMGLSEGRTALDVWTEGGNLHRYDVRVYTRAPSDTLSLVEAILSAYPGVSAEPHLDRILLRGTVDSARMEAFQQVMRGIPQVINLVEAELNVAVEPGIVLDVAVLELNRSHQRNLGIRWQDTAAGPAVGVVGNLVPNRLFGVVSDVGDRGTLQDLLGAVGTGSQKLSGYVGITSILGSELQLLQEEGHAQLLAAPSLSTTSGETATFLAGGELPVAILNEFGQPVVEFREFGIQLEIQPIADHAHNIRSHIRAEVSSVDFSVQVNGVPGLLRRETTSTITARPGETIVLSGLLDARDTRNADRLPGLGDLPILGALFRSKAFNQQRTELVVTVTPRVNHAGHAASPMLRGAEKHLRQLLTGSEMLNAELVE